MELNFLYVKAKNTGIRYLSLAIIKKLLSKSSTMDKFGNFYSAYY